jgi:ElaB/YqjD/DUF883 family membrane-anchored ribosome-binding protein
MNKHIQAISNDVGTLAEDARAFALDGGRKILGRVRDKAVEGARAADETVHEHPYETIGIAFGLGVLVGFLLGRRNSNNED